MLSQYNTQYYLQMIRSKAITFHSINKGPFFMVVDTKLIDKNLCSIWIRVKAHYLINVSRASYRIITRAPNKSPYPWEVNYFILKGD